MQFPVPEIDLPPMHLVAQRLERPRVGDVAAAVTGQVGRDETFATLPAGGSVAVAVGSRGIGEIASIVRTLVAALREAGTEPFIVPAMGSHGGATAEGQMAVLEHLGVTEDTMGVPIRSSMEVVEVASVASPSGRAVPLHMDRHAWEADAIVPVNRVKPHTGFRGPVESGLCKMLAIGLGKQAGAATLHREGYLAFDALILEAGKALLGTGKVAFGLAVVENAFEEIAIVEAVPAGSVVEREQALLETARSLLPGIPLPRVDVLVVERFGKDISGVGMDPAITGRGELGGPLEPFDGPRIGRVVVLGLTEETGGNVHGIGLADLITEDVLRAIDHEVTWTNTLTAGSLACGRIPIALPTEREAILAAAGAVPGVSPEDAGIVRIRDTLHLGEFAVSESLLDDVAATEACTLLGPWDGSWPEG
jgi:hypothetical protein